MDAPAGSGGRDHDDEATRQYLDLMRSLHHDWAELERRGDDSVQLSGRARSALSEAVRADVRHGPRVHMPPTDAGPYTLTELALRSLVRDGVDEVPGAVALRTTFEYRAAADGWGSRGVPTTVACRISAASSTPDLPALAGDVRRAIHAACACELDLPDLVIDIHIEDLHDS